MKTENLKWLVSNALHGDISGDNSNDLQVMIKAEQEFHALLARHNALVEAVAKMFAAHEAWTQKGGASYPDWADGRASYDAARAEVDRILSEEK